MSNHKRKPTIVCDGEHCGRTTNDFYVVLWPKPARHFCPPCYEDHERRDARDDNRRDPPPNKE